MISQSRSMTSATANHSILVVGPIFVRHHVEQHVEIFLLFSGQQRRADPDKRDEVFRDLELPFGILGLAQSSASCGGFAQQPMRHAVHDVRHFHPLGQQADFNHAFSYGGNWVVDVRKKDTTNFLTL